VVGLAPAYAPLFSDRVKQQIRFIFVDFKNTWGAEAPRDVDTITLDTLVAEIDEARRALGLEKACVVPRDAFAMRYVRNSPKYFYDASYDFSWAWVGRDFSVELLNRFFSVIAVDYDPRPKLSANSVPMFLALGRYDYPVPYGMWDGVKEKIPHLTHHLFERSGHFPMLEEHALFDDLLTRWLKKGR